MTFGEHLEELRVCLFFSIIWLVVGFTIGLFAGGYVVDYIQRPLNASLKKFYLDRADERMAKILKDLLNEGQPASVLDVTRRERLVPTEFFIYPGEFERALEFQKRLQQAEDVTGSKMITLDEVDNLFVRKQQREERRHQYSDSLFSDTHTPNYNAKPARILLWTRIDEDARVASKTFNMQESFSIYLKASMLVGLLIAAPGIFYHIWSFVAAGLYPHEKRYVYYFMPISIILFLGGAIFAFFVVFQFILDFLLMFNAWTGIQPEARISEWLSFALFLPIGFGISFQLPLVMFVLERVRIFSIAIYWSQWKMAVVVIVILSMLLTPADPWSMFFMAVPLIILYFGGIGMCQMFPRREWEEIADAE
ncbi:MAG: twin-arginine translocase subunit TatC [Planctomycetaceae bacterium]|nr:twin-arginine translocase subunit TatC [Planctomycetaceae bacterium]